MPTYVMLANWTDQGARNIKESPRRLEAAKKSLREMGGEFRSIYMTLGEYDLVLVYDAPDDAVAARFSPGAGANGFGADPYLEGVPRGRLSRDHPLARLNDRRGTRMTVKTRRLRELLASGEFLYMPSAATPLEGRLAEAAGTPLVYTGGYVSGASRAISEPLLTMDEQVRIAGEVARAVSVPLIADAGAGFGEPLHTMRTVREFAAAGVAGIHIEDQLYPKRAHYHAYQVHAIPLAEFIAKIKYACLQRDETDPDFLIIARSDTAREFGLDEAILRINAAADVGADLGLVFPRSRDEAEAAPRMSAVPLIWVQSRGNRDGRPILPLGELKAWAIAAYRRANHARGRRAFHEEGDRRACRDRQLYRPWRRRVRRRAQGNRGFDRARRLLPDRGRNRRARQPPALTGLAAHDRSPFRVRHSVLS